MSSQSTIYALSTAPGKSGVAVIRISGPRALSVVTTLGAKLSKPRRASLQTLRDPVSRETLDRALVLWFAAPASFTGEDIVELHVHGGRAVIAGIMTALAGIDGLRMAEAGEFARRAFDNGKIDLTQAEGLGDLIDAETEAQRAQALRQSSGALRSLFDGWREQIIRAMVAVEAAIDFSEEADIPEAAFAAAHPVVMRLTSDIGRHLADGRRGEILRDGLRVVIAGPPNAGKSSLLNALAGRDAAIVSEEAGTTRDVIEVRLNLGGYPVVVADTAGIRDVGDKVEREGIRRAIAAATEADLVIWLSDAATPSPPPKEITAFGDKVVEANSKIDLAPAQYPLGLSVLSGEGIESLVERLAEEARRLAGGAEDAIITRARHREALQAAHTALMAFLDGDTGAVEMRAEDLRVAAFALGRLTGRVDVEHVLGEIFSQFCIGK
ncbi:MAG: tRNA uridine-5-carboxymethylaminomethyl(34) synthesis GTPase MnmE [Hyphomicrobiales bacterium]|nr:tRNA uridine-5-carboxymethylaminomethyl(34) synthesis GTPase MnmE [Hyphomicrobiales bacterium]